ncbi:MAG: DUF885 domain-containing protein [Flavobacterium sp.]|nr:DUF885 domain-containing protein [Flavobacterium sp.]
MKALYIILSMAAITAVAGCKLSSNNQHHTANTELAALFDKYYEERLQLFPLEATAVGDNRYNHKLYADFTDTYRNKLKEFYNRYLTYATKFSPKTLNEKDHLNHQVFMYELKINLEGLNLNDNYMPANQFYALPLTMGQLGSGQGNQPFKTVADYNNWLQRMKAFTVWADSAIVYFKKGLNSNVVLPKSLVQKMLPQLHDMVTTNLTKHLFYGPINTLPATFSTSDKQTITANYTAAIQQQIIPTYKKLHHFLAQDYLPKARTTSGINSVAGGGDMYNYLVRLNTSTNTPTENIYQLGLSEVKRIKAEMEKVKTQVGFTGNIAAFFEFMKTDKQFMPYKTPQEVLAAFQTIHQTMKPQLNTMFNQVPKTPFEIRQTEAFRAASASAEYNQGSADGSRPGIFYVPIIDATKFNITSGMESLFLHEAIPGHHYQISLQQEDTLLPKFRRFAIGNNAYVEGWALYCESLGKELGLYTNPYQYMGALGDEMHRAIRLVVDVALHTKGITREEAIAYMMANEPISEAGATAEIERYMAIPAQALSYKIGALKISALRTKYSEQLGAKFKLAKFHDAILKDGSMPLNVLETKMNEWAKKQ